MTAIGVDIGGTRLKVGSVDDQGNVVSQKIVDTPKDFDTFTSTLVSLVGELTKQNEPPRAVGIGCKGIIDANTTRVVTLPGTFKFLEGLSFTELIGPLFDQSISVYADNDARVALAGEVVWGAAKGRNNVVMLTLGTGVGGAVLVDGRILRGATGAAGLLGHVTIVPNGRFCDCGNRGCLETVFSANAIEAEALNVVYRGCESSLTERFKNDLSSITCKAVFEAAAEGDSIARAIRDEAIVGLGAALAGLLHVFDPELVILGGQIASAGETLLGPLQHELEWRTRRFLGRPVPLKLSEIQDTSGIVGAAALTLMN